MLPFDAPPGHPPTMASPRRDRRPWAVGRRATVARVVQRECASTRDGRTGGDHAPAGCAESGADLRRPRGASARPRRPRSPRPSAASATGTTRYCSLRDAALSIDALMLGGYTEEAMDFGAWVLRATASHPSQTQILYGLGGERRLRRPLDWLPGYEGSTPVRVGNAASEQFQLDVFGVLDAADRFRCRSAARSTGSASRRPAALPGGRLARARRGHLGGAGRAATSPTPR